MSTLKIVATGDLHFGHPKLPPEELYGKLCEYLYPALQDAHMLLLTGDIYHDITTVNSKAHKYVTKFMRDLVKISTSTGIIIRILHGTFSHDRDQLDIISSYVPDTIKVINELYVEHITGFPNSDASITVGYLPDNLPYKKSSDAIAHLQDIMRLQGVNELDFILGHGNFVHVIPEHTNAAPPCLYDVTQFKGITNYLIFGHHHIPSKRGNMVYCGSFDRMQHGEEGHKGINLFELDLENRKWKHLLVPNPKANLFISISPEGETNEECADDFYNKALVALNDVKGHSYAHIRCLHPSGEVRALIGKVCAKHLPYVSYTHKSTNRIDDAAELKLDDLHLEFEDVKPTVNNLGDLVYQFLHDNDHVNSDAKESILKSVNTLLHPTGG